MNPVKPPKAHSAARLALSIEEVAATLGIGRTLVYKLIKAKRLRARKIGRRTIIVPEDAAEFLHSLLIINESSASLDGAGSRALSKAPGEGEIETSTTVAAHDGAFVGKAP
jgi:excisionase family DNA binding protein